MQVIINNLLDAFTDTNKVTKSHVLATNVPARIYVHIGQSGSTVSNESKTRLKCGRLVGAKDIVPRKRKGQKRANKEVKAPEENNKPEVCVPEESHPTKQLPFVEV